MHINTLSFNMPICSKNVVGLKVVIPLYSMLNIQTCLEYPQSLTGFRKCA